MRTIITAAVLLVLSCSSASAEPLLKTKTAKVGKLNVVWETESPYVESGKQVFALPSNETAAVSKKYSEMEEFVNFLRSHCGDTPGCELTYETETRAVIAAKSSSGESMTLPFTIQDKQSYPGEQRTISTVLRSWDYDTYTLKVFTSEGIYCIPNDYAWSGYQNRIKKALSRLGESEAIINRDVVLKVHPFKESDGDDCKGYLADVQPVK